MEAVKKCIITRYDPNIVEPPYKTIPIDKMEVTELDDDYLGEIFYHTLVKYCKDKGYVLRFYSLYDGDEDYEVVVY